MPRNVYICIPLTSPDNCKKTRKLLSDLGKPTKRGIKKCPNCGVYNGTRGVMCKNKQCNVVFKETSEKRKVNLEAIRLITTTSRKVFSVRVRDRGPDHRGFVQLPFLHSACESSNQNTFSPVALCFVDTCQRLFDVSILKCHETEQNSRSSTCIHIESALKSCSDGVPLEFKLDVLDSLNISEQLKRKLWLLIKETEDPLVQRVSKSVMAVKCQVTPKHPLGYLHFTFHMNKAKEVYDRYSCSCYEIGRNIKDDASDPQKKCVHYYACICALASDMRFSMEFVTFLGLEVNIANLLVTSEHYRPQMDCIALGNIKTANCASLVHNSQSSFIDLNINQLHNVSYTPSNKVSYLRKHHVSVTNSVKTHNLSNYSHSAKVEPSTWHFTEWLSTVTECINQKLIFGVCGSQESLCFHIPKKFFCLLKERIPTEHMKVEIVNNCRKYQTDDRDVTIYKYIWCLTNILYVKKVFDVVEVQLQTAIISSDANSYATANESNSHSLCYGKYLKVSDKSAYQEESCPFVIEWMPNVSSHLEFGQIKLDFKIGNKYKCRVPK